MKEILLATRNRKKLAELKRLLRASRIKVLGLSDFKHLPKIKEDGRTFRDNARKKAVGISSRTDELVMADDSGLCVPALSNAPGVNSARYAGPSQDDRKNIEKLLRNMQGLKGAKRKASFVCVICISKAKKVEALIDGRVSGKIAFRPKGNFGFGYDPVFIPRGFEKTFAELGAKVKDRISHRAKALKKAKAAVKRYFQRHS